MRAASALLCAALAVGTSACTAPDPRAGVEDIDVELTGCRADNSGTSPRLIVDAAISNTGEVRREVSLTVGFTVPGASASPAAQVESRSLPVDAGETEPLVLSAVLGPEAAGSTVTTVDCALLSTRSS